MGANEELAKGIEEFLEKFRSKIAEMSEEDFATNVNAVVASFLEKVSGSTSCGIVSN